MNQMPGSRALVRVLARVLAAATCSGVAVFLLVMLALQGVQSGYDPRTQFMSELALGVWGAWMMLAFVGLALAAAATALNLYARAEARLLSGLLAFAAVLFLATGIVTLADSALAHVAFIASAFIASGTAMYLLPRAVAVFAKREGYAVSWGCSLIMCGAVAQGERFILTGSAQRVAACALLCWFLYVAYQLARR
ncbi:hypothetical protein FACS1894101_3750 [Betaproteobacteria bacterium]|nr:hypothetical protein FACS1894101_3750 [Betaproteobacteria bacterium]